MKKLVIMISIFFVLVLGTVLGLGTYAWFTSQATSVDNIFESGSLIIGVPHSGRNDAFLSAQGLFPGSSITKTVEVKNLGSMIFHYKVSSVRDTGDEVFYNKLNILIKKDNTEIYNGLLKDLNKKIGSLESKNSEALTFTISMPLDADNYYQGKMAKVNFIFDATQTENQLL